MKQKESKHKNSSLHPSPTCDLILSHQLYFIDNLLQSTI